MKKKTLYIIIILTLVSGLRSQTFELSVLNQTVSGTDLLFDIYLLRTGTTDIYLGETDMVLIFNSEYFTEPAYTVVTSGLTTDYSFSPEIRGTNRAVLNIRMPAFSNQSEFDSRVQQISNSSPGTFIAAMKISGISNPSGSSGLDWRTAGNQRTNLHTLDNSTPWSSSDISSNGIYLLPADISLPVELISFSALSGNRQVILKWQTASEIENAGFEIYRAQSETGNYQIIASYLNFHQLAGAGNSNSPHSYEYTNGNLINGKTYWFKLADVNINGGRHFHDAISVVPSEFATTSLPDAFALEQNYPNPFNPITAIKFDIPQISGGFTQIELSIYDIIGQKVRTLLNGQFPPGSHTAEWNGRDNRGKPVPSGVYFYGILSDQFIAYRKMMLIR